MDINTRAAIDRLVAAAQVWAINIDPRGDVPVSMLTELWYATFQCRLIRSDEIDNLGLSQGEAEILRAAMIWYLADDDAIEQACKDLQAVVMKQIWQSNLSSL